LLDQDKIKAIALLGPSLFVEDPVRQDTVGIASNLAKTIPMFVGISGSDGENAPGQSDVSGYKDYTGQLGSNPHYRLAVDANVTSDVIQFLEGSLQ
jgi:hypothetical protein